MKSTNPVIALAGFLVALPTMTIAQAANPDTAAKISAEDDQAIRQTLMGIETAWNSHDMKMLAELFTEDAEWVNIVGMHWRGRDAVVKAHTVFHEIMFKDHRMKTDRIEVRSIGGRHAIAVVTTTNDAFTTPSGDVRPEAQSRLTYVLARGQEGWKIVHGHNVGVDAEAAKNDPVNSPPP